MCKNNYNVSIELEYLISIENDFKYDDKEKKYVYKIWVVMIKNMKIRTDNFISVYK